MIATTPNQMIHDQLQIIDGALTAIDRLTDTAQHDASFWITIQLMQSAARCLMRAVELADGD